MRFALAVLVAFSLPTTGFAAPAQIKGVLNYSGTPQKNDALRQEAFFATLAAYDGQVVHLSLTLISSPDGGKDYDLTGVEDKASLRCGDGRVGLIDNLSALYQLSFNHPDHNHAPVELTVGDRLKYPQQDIACKGGGPAAVGPAALTVEGYYQVSVNDIPTAQAFTLFSANPG